MRLDPTDGQRRKRRRRDECRECGEKLDTKKPASLLKGYELRGFCCYVCMQLAYGLPMHAERMRPNKSRRLAERFDAAMQNLLSMPWPSQQPGSFCDRWREQG